MARLLNRYKLSLLHDGSNNFPAFLQVLLLGDQTDALRGQNRIHTHLPEEVLHAPAEHFAELAHLEAP